MLSRNLLAYLILLVIIPAQANAGPHTEDFTTTAFKDTVNTIADWNTGDGELKLFPFMPTLAGTYNTPGSDFGTDC